MKKLVLSALLAFMATLLPMSASAVSTTPTTPPLVDGPLLISRYSLWGNQLRHVEIYNNSDEVVSLAGWSLWAGDADEIVLLVTIPTNDEQFIAPGTHRAIADVNFAPTASYAFSYATGPGATRDAGWKVTFRPPVPTVLDVAVTPSTSGSTISNPTTTPATFLFARTISTSTGNYNSGYSAALLNFDFEKEIPTVRDVNQPLFQVFDDGPYIAPPLNECANLRLSEIGANLSNQFIEVYNAGATPLELGGCLLQTNRSQTVSYVFPQETLPAGALKAVAITGTGLTLTKTTTGTVYVLSSDGQTEVDAREYSDMSENTSFSLVDGVWQQTFAVTPGATNSYEPYPPCETGYVRNLDTGRCNKVAVAASLTPCKVGQYRSEDTNRCRNLTSASTSLAPCDEGKERNPVTNRCRSVLGASASLQPCGEGKERNPATNRCRNVAAALADTAYPVEPIPNSESDTLGWLAFGFVGLLATGYGIWEWRSEIGASLLRLRRAILKL